MTPKQGRFGDIKPKKMLGSMVIIKILTPNSEDKIETFLRFTCVTKKVNNTSLL